MANEQTLDTLERWGDTFERAICAARYRQIGDLGLVLYPYSGLWYDHILSRRDPLDLRHLHSQFSAWIPFAASHYSALIKVHQASECLQVLIGCCEQARGGCIEAALMLDAQESAAGFWEHLGSTIDNLGKCFDEIPGGGQGTGGAETLKAHYDLLKFAYDRRTQMIHKALVPIGIDDGAIVFNERHFDSKETDWRIVRCSPEWVDTYYVDQWRGILSQLGAAWSRLRNKVKQWDPSPPPIPEPLLDPETAIGDGENILSGSNHEYIIQSKSTGKPPGKDASPYWERTKNLLTPPLQPYERRKWPRSSYTTDGPDY